jgi:hypothetical protein
MGPGGPRGLQILQSGADTVRGGFDSHASPPALFRILAALLLLVLPAGWGTARAEAPADTAASAPAGTTVLEAPPAPADTAAGREASPPPARITPGKPAAVWMGRGPSPGGAALRSFILPGWGQAANHKWLKTVGFLGAYAGFWAWSISLHQERMDAVGRFNAASTDSARSRWKAEIDRTTSARNGKYWMAGLTLLLSVADAYVDAALANFDKRMDADVGFVPAGEDPAVGIRLSLAWDTPDSGGSRRNRAR